MRKRSIAVCRVSGRSWFNSIALEVFSCMVIQPPNVFLVVELCVKSFQSINMVVRVAWPSFSLTSKVAFVACTAVLLLLYPTAALAVGSRMLACHISVAVLSPRILLDEGL